MFNKRKRAALAAVAMAAVGAAYLAWQGGAVTTIVKPAATPIGWAATMRAVAGDGSAGLADGPGGQARFSDPFGLALAPSGHLYVADAGDNNRIRKIAPDGTVSTVAGGREGFADGIGEAAAFHTPSGLALDGAGNLYVADTGNHAIRKIDAQGVVSTLAGGGGPGYRDGKGAEARFNGPLGVAIDRAGRVLVADTYNDRIRRIAADGSVTTLAGGAQPGYLDGPAADALFDTPSALLADAAGNILIADTQNGAIRKLAPDGMVTTYSPTLPAAGPAQLRRPLALALTADGVLYVGDMARGRILQLAADGVLHGLTGIGIDIAVGDAAAPRFTRPSAIVLDRRGNLYVADASRRSVRKLMPAGRHSAAGPLPAAAPVLAAARADGFPWPFAPQHRAHEVVGILGEVRGSYSGESRDHFHGGLDVQAAMGVPVLAVAAEKVSSPLPNWGYGELGEGLGIDSMAYIHMRVGRTVANEVLDPARFALLPDANGKPTRVRVRRGTRFAVGDPLGTVNRMFHVHLEYRQAGAELNPLLLPFTGLSDSIAPRIDSIQLHDARGQRLLVKERGRLLVAREAGPLAIVVDAWDQTDGNAARRKLGLYKAGYQLLRDDGSALPGFAQPRVTIEFKHLPPDPESVQLAYAANSGITVYGSAVTRFLYVVTNTVRDGAAAAGAWDPAQLAPGNYIIRILAADYLGNEALAGRDLAITVR